MIKNWQNMIQVDGKRVWFCFSTDPRWNIVVGVQWFIDGVSIAR